MIAGDCNSTDWLIVQLMTSLCTESFVVSMATDSTSSSSTNVHVNFSNLYMTLCRTLHTEQTTLLLYMLLHRVESVRAFILSRANIDHLVCTSDILITKTKTEMFNFSKTKTETRNNSDLKTNTKTKMIG